MSEIEILWWITLAIAFAAGFGLGHQRGQIVGIKWCIDKDAEIAGAPRYSFASTERELDDE